MKREFVAYAAEQLTTIGGQPVNIAQFPRFGDRVFEDPITRKATIELSSRSDPRAKVHVLITSLVDDRQRPSARVLGDDESFQTVNTLLKVQDAQHVIITHKDPDGGLIGQLVIRDSEVTYADPVRGPMRAAIDEHGIPLSPFCTLEFMPQLPTTLSDIAPIVIEVNDWVATRTQ